jgi:ABC-type glycerol-3-phosphate transport system substrate-binding protein
MKQPALWIVCIAGVGAAAAVGMAGQADADSWETTPPTVPYAGSTPGTGDTAQTVIANLQASGTRVTVNKIGEAPIDRCKVISLTPGPPITSQVSGGGGNISWQSQPVTYLTADCTTHGSPKGG